ncbi:MAG: glycosyltransferase [Patescibacteria group bacterium]|nr:glycosyltransferase [Patescibacteria group bacterium]
MPAYNEELILKKNILKLLAFCRKDLDLDLNWQIVIADNQSMDRTKEIGQKLAMDNQKIDYLHLNQKGKGAAIRTGWTEYSADIYCFMDADLATDLTGLPLLINGILEGHDAAIGSRFHFQSKVGRSLFRKFVSHIYRLMLKIVLKIKINDAPCGFKAITHEVKEEILPQVKNNDWFFDSELVILAEKKGYKIKEIPIVWEDFREGEDKSRVNILKVMKQYLREVILLKKRITKL